MNFVSFVFVLSLLSIESSLAFERIELSNVKSPEVTRLADLNGDGLLDIVTAELNNESFVVFLQSPDHKFYKSQNLTMQSSKTFLMNFELGQFNEDSYPDLMAYNTNNKIVFFKGVGNGTFVEKNTFKIKGQTEIVTRRIPGQNELIVMPTYITFGKLNIFKLSSVDGWETSRVEKQTLQLAQILKDFKLLGLKVEIDEFSLGNFNSDKYLDLAIVSAANDYIIILNGDKKGQFAFSHILRTSGGPTALQLFDLNNDGLDELFVGHYKDDLTYVYAFEKGQLKYQQSLYSGKYTSGFAWHALTKTLASLNYYRGELKIYNKWAKTYITYSPVSQSKEARRGSFLNGADFNKDGQQDYVITDFRGKRLLVLISK